MTTALVCQNCEITIGIFDAQNIKCILSLEYHIEVIPIALHIDSKIKESDQGEWIIDIFCVLL